DVAQILAMRAGIEAMIVDALSSKHVSSWENDEPEGNPSEFQRAAWAEALDALKKMERLARTAGDVDERELTARFADEDTRFHASLARAADYDLAARHI